MIKTHQRSGLLAFTLLLLALLSGCGSTNKDNIPATEDVFYAHSVVFGQHSTLWTAGYNGFGQLGNDSLNTSPTFTRPAITQPVLGFAAGANHTVAFTNNSTIWVWGSNIRGRLGVGDAVPTTGSNAASRVPVEIHVGHTVSGVAAGWMHSLAIAGANRSVLTWGANYSGQLGNGTIVDSPIPIELSALDNVKQVAAGGSHSLALKDDGTIWSWGDNTFGQLGRDTSGALFDSVPLQISFAGLPAGVTVKQIAAAGSYSMALMSNGTVWAWGINADGELAQPPFSTTDRLKDFSVIPKQVMNADGTPLFAVKVSAGVMHALALKADVNGNSLGEVWSWGFNQQAQLGVPQEGGRNINKSVPVRAYPTVIVGVTDIYAFGNQSFAKVGNVLNGWGDNGSGQLGQPISNQTIGYLLAPVPIVLPDTP